jgi:pimeloyl-ACP methyl ester carboxylesterase
VETAAVLWDLADGPGGRGGHLLAGEPVRTPIAVPYRDGTSRDGTSRDRTLAADLYLPTRPAGAGLVLLPGLTPQGKDDPRMVDLAATLARARFTVLVPDLSGRRNLSAGTRDVPEILAAVTTLSDRLGGRPVLVAGISFAAGPAVLSALEPAGRDRIGGILALGGYHDLTHMVAWVTTGQRREDGAWVRGTPPDLAVWLFLRGNLGFLNDPNDRAILSAIADRRSADPTAAIADLAESLGPEGRAVLALLLNRDPMRVPALMEQLPRRLREELAALDLSRADLSALAAPLILVHGKDDPVIPWTESADLAAAKGIDGAYPSQGALFLVGNLTHTEIGAIAMDDLRVLWRAVVLLLAERDRLAQSVPPVAETPPSPGS